jgi:2-polyprenyl-3-methyl-5-hydroxy-6-metoxy-1,4-benzoquinol methylase
MNNQMWYQSEKYWWNEFSEPMLEQWTLSPVQNFIVRRQFKQGLLDFLYKSKGCLLDIGCGAGELSVEFASHSMNVVGVDLSGSQITAAKRRAVDASCNELLELYECNFLEWEFHSNWEHKFDSICCSAFLHHLPKEDIVKIFAKIDFLLKPGGKLFLYEPVYNPSKTKGAKFLKFIDFCVQKLMVLFLVKLPGLLKLRREKYELLSSRGYTGCSPMERPLDISILNNCLQEGYSTDVRGQHLYSLQFAMNSVELKGYYRRFLYLPLVVLRGVELFVLAGKGWWQLTNERRFTMVSIGATKNEN